VLTTPFLTELDSRAAIKGSRDPLGVQQIWTRLGRQVVGNLTTVSNSVRDFTVLLLGYYFVERVADEVGQDADLATFLKWEQLVAPSVEPTKSARPVRLATHEPSLHAPHPQPAPCILGSTSISTETMPMLINIPYQ